MADPCALNWRGGQIEDGKLIAIEKAHQYRYAIPETRRDPVPCIDPTSALLGRAAPKGKRGTRASARIFDCDSRSPTFFEYTACQQDPKTEIGKITSCYKSHGWGPQSSCQPTRDLGSFSTYLYKPLTITTCGFNHRQLCQN